MVVHTHMFTVLIMPRKELQVKFHKNAVMINTPNMDSADFDIRLGWMDVNWQYDKHSLSTDQPCCVNG